MDPCVARSRGGETKSFASGMCRCFWSFCGSREHGGLGQKTESQSDVYAEVGPEMLDNLFQGFNTCMFCYGQTGSGKTYTVRCAMQSRCRLRQGYVKVTLRLLVRTSLGVLCPEICTLRPDCSVPHLRRARTHTQLHTMSHALSRTRTLTLSHHIAPCADDGQAIRSG